MLVPILNVDTPPGISLIYISAVPDVTVIVITQDDAPAGRLPPVNDALPALAVAVSVPPITAPPVQVDVAFGTAAFTNPNGYVSVNDTPVAAGFPDGLLIVIVIVLVAFTAIVVGLKLFVTVGGVAVTVNVAVAATVFGGTFADVTSPMGIKS